MRRADWMRVARRSGWLAMTLVWSGMLIWGAACRSTPVTGRKQMLLVPETQEVALGAAAFQDVVSKEPASQNQQYVEMVNRVGQRIAAAANKPDYQWEFKVVATSQQNAFCLPGGKVVVHEGILPICQTEAGLAVVMSHEVAHALARHGGERMTQSYAVDGAKQALSYFSQSQDQMRQEMIMKAYGAASQYGFILPYSRKHESEADHIGLMLMAKAGYDPTEAPRFWQRFGQINAANKPTEFFSTHPSDENRAAALITLLPEAQNVYQVAQQKYGSGEVIQASLTTPAAAPSAGPPAAGPPAAGSGAGAGAAPLNPPAFIPPPFIPPAPSAPTNR
ncbi:MAG: M48 family metallopeptidase [Planctomycetota bacterium]